jgi:hypothetical protein
MSDAEQAVAIFKESIKEFVSINDQLKRASAELLLVKKQRDSLGEVIRNFMSEKNYEAVASGDVTVVRKTTSRKTGIKEDDILNIAKKFLGDDEASKFMTSLNDTREIKTSEKIKLQNNSRKN